MCAQVREHPFAVLDRREPLRLTASLGVAHAPSQAGDLRSLYAAADAALYNAKEAGRDRVAVLPAVTPAAPLQRRTA
jgi:diguanylate cyclase (GGDEF)-like protein